MLYTYSYAFPSSVFKIYNLFISTLHNWNSPIPNHGERHHFLFYFQIKLSKEIFLYIVVSYTFTTKLSTTLASESIYILYSQNYPFHSSCCLRCPIWFSQKCPNCVLIIFYWIFGGFVSPQHFSTYSSWKNK